MANKNLITLLRKLHDAIDELEAALTEEISQLNRSQINPVPLQILSDSKSQLLATIQHYDELRKQEEIASEISAPYPDHAKIALLWQAIMIKVEHANTLNNKVHTLLESHMHKNNQLRKLVSQAGGDNSLYGAAGRSQPQDSGRVCNITI